MKNANVCDALARVMDAQNNLTAAVQALTAIIDNAPAIDDVPTFEQVERDIAAGNMDKYRIGGLIRARHEVHGTIPFIIIGKGHDHEPDGSGTERITAQALHVLEYRPFAVPKKGYPWGQNDYVASDIRDYLNGTFFDDFADEDKQAVVGALKRTYTPNYDDLRGPGYFSMTRELFFLLSASEAGFKGDNIMDEGPVYAFYKACDEKRRIKTDQDDDETFWWLRSPYPSNLIVRYVNTSGALSNSNANGGLGLAPACVIGK